MTIAKAIRQNIENLPTGQPFSTNQFVKLGARYSIDKALSRMVKSGFIERLTRGLFVRPKQSRYIQNITPDITDIVSAIAQAHGETIQVHGAEAARRFKLTTQMPTQPVYYTSGTTRVLNIGNLNIKFIHTNNHRKLQYAGQPAGLALSALWYLGKENFTVSTLEKIRDQLDPPSFSTLCHSTDMPGWMEQVVKQYQKESSHA